MSDIQQGINPEAKPSGNGCVECEQNGGWWFHLRRCAQCGHVGCCDSSPQQHSTKHFHETKHPIIQSFEPGEHWYYDFRTGDFVEGAAHLAPPDSHPKEQAVPGPHGRVPADWQSQLN